MGLSFLQKPVLSVPDGVDPKHYYRCLLGPIALGLSVGVQITMTAFLLLGPGSTAGLADQLTQHGKAYTRPEHDLILYVLGAGLTVVMSGLTMWYWRARLARVEAARAPEFMTAAALLQGLLAMTSMVAFALLLCSDWFSRDFRSVAAIRAAPDKLDSIILLVPCVIALVCTTVDLWRGFGAEVTGAPKEQWRLRRDEILRYAVPVFVILILGVSPDRWRYLAGQIFVPDLCHHLNFFFMGPALSFAHGKAFGTEIYSQYGVGWPMLASGLARFSALTYGNLIGIEIVYSCVYCLALFFLLSYCFKDGLWAAVGVLLAIYWQLFSGKGVSELIWSYPSTTMIRHPLDIWFFLAVVMHQRSGRNGWAVVAGLMAALGVLFETETGLYLLVTFFIYSALRAGLATDQARPTGWKAMLLPPALFCGAVIVALLPLLLYASRGTLFSGAFLAGWVEALVRYGAQGLSALPIADLPDAPLIYFLIMFATYLGVIVYAGLKALHGSARQGEVLLAALAAYGLAVLLLFIGRSHPFNLCHATPPFAVLVTALMFHGYTAIPSRLRSPALPYALAVSLGLLLLTKPAFRQYPNLLASLFAERPTGGLSLRLDPPDVCGLPREWENFTSEVHSIGSTIQMLAPDGQGVAILDLNDTMLYSVAEACPWSRYPFVFQMALTKQFVTDTRDDLVRKLPRLVVIRGENATRPPYWDFVWRPLFVAVTNHYTLCQTVGPYEIYAKPDGALAHSGLAEAAQAKGQLAEAIAQYCQALQLEPDLPVALNNLAWIRAANADPKFRDGGEAVRLAERACRVTRYRQPMLMGTLAAAYAEAGRFDEAVAAAEKARVLALATGQKELADKEAQLAGLFRTHKACHEPATQ
jgi:hypothetical protein